MVDRTNVTSAVPRVPDARKCRDLAQRMLDNISDAPEDGGGPGWNKQEAVAAYRKLKEVVDNAVSTL
jgi:hypothetical protein